ncbi:hypothetical protein LV84_00745 [Algoriphagus ratkowskyi]|uniref:Uncharacterized protein n=1 Tax=Algoriphagus ratkowskyi TaxID=57028 RepID=A0A2W7RNB5_9BACT|nr:hypothetical protein [Algoriphagus ratkowskyi]PZX60466.1 hypothetical protein LV84_00745 [Algoriphagus ratkowskyi]TXD78270.1 hypothetical protein ESW18_09555 [Algoriphagus ratkowskyi]
MRKLTEQELEWIHTRLKSLHIRYTEVYEETFDHYHSALERCSVADSAEVFRKLNKDFSRDAVKKMEKELRKTSQKQVTKMQIESFMFWKYDVRTSISFIALSTVSVLISILFGKYLLSAWLGIVIVTGLVFMFSKDKSLFHFNLVFWKKSYVRAVTQEIYGRFAILSGVGISSILNIPNMRLEIIFHQAGFFDISNIFLLIVLIYGLSLFRIVLSLGFSTTTKLHSI